jgi:hypothetical protein
MESELEAEFRALMGTVGREIYDKVEAASKLLDEAEELANKHGVPFYGQVSPLGQAYIPRSFQERFAGLKPEIAEEIAHMEIDGYGNGWERSALC